VLLYEFTDDWIAMRLNIKALSVKVPVSDLIFTAVAAAGTLIMNSEANLKLVLANQKGQEICDAFCNLLCRTMQAPTMETLANLILIIGKTCSSERNRLCTSLEPTIAADMDTLNQLFGKEEDPELEFEICFPSRAEMATLVNYVNRKRAENPIQPGYHSMGKKHKKTTAQVSVIGHIIWENVSSLKLGTRSVIAKHNTIYATEMGVWFMIDDANANSVQAFVDMADVRSVEIDGRNGMISLNSALETFGSFTLTVAVCFESRAEAQTFVQYLQQKLEIFKLLGEFVRRAAFMDITVHKMEQYLNLSNYRIRQLYAQGMPFHSVASVKEWRAVNIAYGKTADNRGMMHEPGLEGDDGSPDSELPARHHQPTWPSHRPCSSCNSRFIQYANRIRSLFCGEQCCQR